MNRRRLLVTSTSAATLAACSSSSTILAPQLPGSASSAARRLTSSTFTRLEIAEFSKQPKLVAALRRGIEAMWVIHDARNTAGYAYWHYSYWLPDGEPPEEMRPVWNQCKHKTRISRPGIAGSYTISRKFCAQPA